MLKLLLLSSLLILSGCAKLNVLTGNQTMSQSALTKTCRQSPVLITDLTIPQQERTYVLPNGQVCPARV